MRHNKKRNTALLYEFLIRHISKCLIDKNHEESNKTVSLLKRHFGSGPLREELRLTNSLLANRVKTLEYATKIIDQVCDERAKIDSQGLDRAKSKLIREVNELFDPNQIYAYKIPDYVVYASVQMLLNEQAAQKLDSVERIKLQERIAQHLLREEKTESVKDAIKLNPNYNGAVYKLVLRKFDEKYSQTLSEAQKKLLTKYAVSLVTENKKVVASAIRHEVEHAESQLAFIKDPEVAKDKDLLNKISECRDRMRKVDPDDISDTTIVKVLRFMALANEVAA